MKKRFQFWLDMKVLIKLQKLHRKTGSPIAEIIRRAIDNYLKLK